MSAPLFPLKPTDPPPVRTAQTTLRGAREGAVALHAALWQPRLALVLFFCTADIDLPAFADALGGLFPGVPMAGCSTAGEIGPDGCLDGSVSAIAFPADDFTAVVGALDDLQSFTAARGRAFAQRQLQHLEALAPQTGLHNSFGLLLVDGLSMREETVTGVLQEALGPLPLVGGSAADGQRFVQTWVYADGALRRDAAAVALVTTTRPFKPFKIQHFVATDDWLVVTRADASRRIVHEINGLTAAEEYARLVGVDVASLGAQNFAAAPVVVLIDGSNYVRAIQRIDADGSIHFFCAIEEGLVLRIARGLDMVHNLQQAFESIHADIGTLETALVFDCVLRKLEMQQQAATAPIAALYRGVHAVGFHTYGEQYCGVHVNQTLTGIAFGARHG